MYAIAMYTMTKSYSLQDTRPRSRAIHRTTNSINWSDRIEELGFIYRSKTADRPVAPQGPGKRHNYIGHNYIGIHAITIGYLGHNYIGYTDHNYIGYPGHSYMGPVAP